MKVGESTPSQLATKLLARGLQSGTPIMVTACESGVIDTNRGTTYVSELTKEISKQSEEKVKVTPHGVTGLGVVLEDGRIVASDSDKLTETKFREYESIREPFKEWNKSVQTFIEIVLRQGFNLQKAAQIVADATQEEFSKLYEYMETVTRTSENSLVSGSTV